jgi:hypothetical protein
MAANPGSSIVFVVANANDVRDVVVILFLFLKEGVVIIVAKIDVIVIIEIRHVIAASRFFVGVFQRYGFRRLVGALVVVVLVFFVADALWTRFEE